MDEGLIEVGWDAVPYATGLAALWAHDQCTADLGLPPLWVRWMLPDGPGDHTLLGWTCSGAPIIWVRADASPAEVVRIVAHEARHQWQFMIGRIEQTDDGHEWREADANAYAGLLALPSLGLGV